MVMRQDLTARKMEHLDRADTDVRPSQPFPQPKLVYNSIIELNDALFA